MAGADDECWFREKIVPWRALEGARRRKLIMPSATLATLKFSVSRKIENLYHANGILFSVIFITDSFTSIALVDNACYIESI
ncbi:MAG TPA: hypothetical protein V6C72_09930 [Chroococcales cyanobacterium]